LATLALPSGHDLHYEVHGQGPPLLLVSGLGGAATFWQVHVPTLAERFTVVLHDHLGTGRSSRPRIDYSVEQMAGDVLALMDHLDLRRAHYVGHSTGGAIGQTLALDHPEHIEKLVLSASWPAADAFFRLLFDARGETLRRLGPRAYLRASALALMPPRWLRDHPAEHEIDDDAAAQTIPDPEIVLRRIGAILRFGRRAELHRITAATLVVGARDDAVTPAYFSEELGRLIPDATTIILPEGGHFFPRIHPERFRRVLLDFLGGG
jgi:aminoacrylate hydrolase